MKILSPPHAHLTANEKAAIKAILASGNVSGKVGRTQYWMRSEGVSIWSVTIRKAGRGIGIGGDLRPEQRTVKIEL